MGALVAVVKAVLTAGHAKAYRPIDLKLLPPNLPYPRVEPGRIEVGVCFVFKKSMYHRVLWLLFSITQ